MSVFQEIHVFSDRLRGIASVIFAVPGVRTQLLTLADDMDKFGIREGVAAAANDASPKPEIASEEPSSARVCLNCRGDSEVFAPGLCPTCDGTGVEQVDDVGAPLKPGEIEWLAQPEDQALEAMLKDMLNGVDMAMGVRAGELLRFYEPAEACARARAEFMHDRERVVKAIVDIRMRQTPRFEVRQ